VKLVTYTAENNRRFPRRFSKGKVNSSSNIYYERNIGKMLGAKYRHTSFIFKQRMTLYGERKYGVKCIKCPPPPQKIVTWRRILSNEIYAKLKIGKHLSCEFKVNKGLR
jgi:hypothetical protein